MKTTMTSRERILATCAHEPTDHVPLHLEVHPSYCLYDPVVAWWNNQFERTDDLLALGADAMVEVWLPDPSYHPDVEVRTWREEPPNQEYALLGKEYRTPAGPLRQVIKETDDLYDWHKINRNTRAPIAERRQSLPQCGVPHQRATRPRKDALPVPADFRPGPR